MAAHKLAVWSLATLAAAELALRLELAFRRRHCRPGPRRCRHGDAFADCPECWRD